MVSGWQSLIYLFKACPWSLLLNAEHDPTDMENIKACPAQQENKGLQAFGSFFKQSKLSLSCQFQELLLYPLVIW